MRWRFRRDKLRWLMARLSKSRSLPPAPAIILTPDFVWGAVLDLKRRRACCWASPRAGSMCATLKVQASTIWYKCCASGHRKTNDSADRHVWRPTVEAKGGAHREDHSGSKTPDRRHV